MQKGFTKSFGALEGVFDLTRRFFERERIEDRHRFAVDLAIEEVFTNMVKYQPEGSESILISLRRIRDDLHVQITDYDSEPFDPTQAGEADVNSPLDQRAVGGLGLHLLRKMVDRIEYEYVGRNSRITITRRLE